MSKQQRQPVAVVKANILPEVMKIKNKTWPTKSKLILMKLIETNEGVKKNLELKKNLEPIKPVSNNNMEILTKALYHIQRREGANLELDPVKFKHMIKATNSQLKGLTIQSSTPALLLYTNEQNKEENLGAQPRRNKETRRE
ncbi:hypothetical protein C2G38_2186075 [Gigaspora rosea]|uniref:Uncharacterized protein n=1 Tax=Gigaspora rosea TaxID=44941 RepID=A0A397V9D8_9GLOM|nr:hypothetical protein C2G38_2186075 [Gigaspora rosea]